MAGKIETLEGFVDYIKLIGAAMPIINIELYDEHIEQLIYDGLNEFVRYSYLEGSFLEYCIVTFEAGQDEIPANMIYDKARNRYIESDTIVDIYDFDLSFSSIGNINTMFSPTNVLLYNLAQSRQFPVTYGRAVGGSNSGLVLTEYQLAMNTLEQVRDMFGKSYTLKYIAGQDVIKITPIPTESISGTLGIYKRQSAQYLYNHPLVKKLIIGKMRMLWGGIVLSKYNGVTMPDGSSPNGQFIYEMGRSEVESVMSDIRAECAPIDFFVA